MRYSRDMFGMRVLMYSLAFYALVGALVKASL